MDGQEAGGLYKGPSSPCQWVCSRFCIYLQIILHLIANYLYLFAMICDFCNEASAWMGEQSPPDPPEVFWKSRRCCCCLFLGWTNVEHYSDLSLGARTGAVILHTAAKDPALLISLKPKHGIYIFSKLFFMVLIYV